MADMIPEKYHCPHLDRAAALKTYEARMADETKRKGIQ